MNAPHTLAALRRRHWLLQAAAAVATATLASTGGAQTAKLPAKGGEPVELKWDDLVPKGWDPMKGLPANAGNLAKSGPGTLVLTGANNAPVVATDPATGLTGMMTPPGGGS